MKKINDEKQKMAAQERRKFVKNFITVSIFWPKSPFDKFFKELLKNRVQFKYCGKAILEFKLTRLSKMTDDEIKDLLFYLRSVFKDKYMPEKTARQSKLKRKYSPVVTIQKK